MLVNILYHRCLCNFLNQTSLFHRGTNSSLLSTESRPAVATPRPANSERDGTPRRSLNLEDYKKRRGLI